jgi:hypothetical protein
MPSSMRPQQRRHCRPRPPLQVAPNHITTPSRLFKVTTNTMTSTSIMKSGDDSVMFDEDYNKHTKAKTMMVLYPWRTNNQAKMLPRRRRWPVTSTRNKNKPNGVDAINEKGAAAENKASCLPRMKKKRRTPVRFQCATTTSQAPHGNVNVAYDRHDRVIANE